MTIARSTSRHWTLPEPSQIELSGLSRKRRGIPDSSTKPLPPKHSRHSTAWEGARLQIQYLSTALATRLRLVASSSPAIDSS